MAAFGAMAAAPAAVTAKQIEAADALDLPTPSNLLADCVGIPPQSNPFWEASRHAREALWRQRSEFDERLNLPPRIAGKKSWSEEFKRGQARKQYWRLQSLLNQLDDEKTGGVLLKILMGDRL
jgi:hypothetical protein